MPLLLSDRAQPTSPLPLYTVAESRMLGIRLSTPQWRRVRKGVYVDRAAFDALAPSGRYAVRVHAYLQRHPIAVLCLESAAVVHGIPGFGEPKDIHVYDPELAKSWRHGDVESARHDRGSCPSRSARACAGDGGCFDLPGAGRHAQPRRAARSQRQSAEQAWQGADALGLGERGWPGRDFYFESCRAVGEADGWGKYELSDPDRARDRFKEEKRREDRLRRRGHPFARWELRDAWRVTPLCEALALAGVRVVRAQRPAMLATLRSNPRGRSWREMRGSA